MNKLKKVISSIGVFIIGMISKVYAIGPDTIISMYAVDPGPSPRQTIGETISKIGKITIPFILFVIGLFVILSKKITKKVKAIVISTLIILGVLAWTILNYFADMI